MNFNEAIDPYSTGFSDIDGRYDGAFIDETIVPDDSFSAYSASVAASAAPTKITNIEKTIEGSCMNWDRRCLSAGTKCKLRP